VAQACSLQTSGRTFVVARRALTLAIRHPQRAVSIKELRPAVVKLCCLFMDQGSVAQCGFDAWHTLRIRLFTRHLLAIEINAKFSGGRPTTLVLVDRGQPASALSLGLLVRLVLLEPSLTSATSSPTSSISGATMAFVRSSASSAAITAGHIC
jgi:hypothetical protein